MRVYVYDSLCDVLKYFWSSEVLWHRKFLSGSCQTQRFWKSFVSEQTTNSYFTIAQQDDFREFKKQKINYRFVSSRFNTFSDIQHR